MPFSKGASPRESEQVCTFTIAYTEESVDMILYFTDSYGNPAYVHGDDGFLYISLYIENNLPSYDEFDVVWEDDGWKCALNQSN